MCIINNNNIANFVCDNINVFLSVYTSIVVNQ